MNNGVQGIQGETGNGIASIQKTGTSGLVDTYTITYTNGNTTTFTVSNGKGISSIVKTGSAGLIDNYRITYNDGTYFDYIVTNGQDGEVTEEELQDVYEQMSSELEDGTGTGTSIDTSDSAYWKAEIGLSGNTDQDSYEGYNVLKPTNSVSANNISYDKNTSILTFNISTGSTSSYPVLTNCIGQIAPGTYTIVAEKITGNIPNKVMNVGLGTNNWNLGINLSNLFSTNKYVKTVEINSTLSEHIYFQIQGNVVLDNVQIRIWLLSGTYTLSNVPDFEKYVGGIPSPNPDYPQDIQVVKGSNNVNVHSGNFLDNNFNFQGGKFGNNNLPSPSESATFIYENNTLKMKGTSWTGVYDSNYHEILPNTEFTFCVTKNKTCFARIVEYNSNKTIVTRQTGTLNKTFTTSSNTKYIRFSFELTSDTTDYLVITEMRIVKGSLAIPYADCTEQNYPITLPTGMELCKIGDYSDVIFKNEPSNPLYNSSLVQNAWYKKGYIGKLVLEGQGFAGFASGNSIVMYSNYENMFGQNLITGTFIKGICNREVVQRDAFVAPIGTLYISDDGTTMVITNSSLTTKEEWQQYFQEKPHIIYGILSTPTDTQITDTTLVNQLNDIEKKLKTYQGVTHITQTNSDMPFILSLDYKKSNLLRIQALENA